MGLDKDWEKVKGLSTRALVKVSSAPIAIVRSRSVS